MTTELEAPSAADELYLARGDEVVDARPVMTGDVFSGIAIPGLDDGEGEAIVVTHPCSMRVDGVRLVERLLVARVEPYQSLPLKKWASGHWKVIPLPQVLLTEADLAGKFDKIGLVPSGAIETANRLACLSPFGINLLQQRFVWHLTRFLVPTFRLNEACAAVFEEADLQEEWVSNAVERGATVAAAAEQFHEWIRADDGTGRSRQQLLSEPQQLAGIRREMRRECASRR